MAPAEPEAAAGQTIAGRYELVQQIARGGMGTVWVAEDAKLGRRVALKVMRRESLEAFEDARERFEREARAAAALGTAHVVQVHDYGVDHGVPFIAMEYLEGESLKARLERRGKLSIQETAELLGQVAKGLKAAHKAGLIHRDLKPSNIFITHRDDREVVKLLDFGVVKAVMARGAEETASGILLGTPQFMSPEQARGLRKIDHRADLWSLGVILYLVLTGENPFDSVAEAVGDIVIRVCIEPISAPSIFNPDLSEAIDEFFERALERDPDRRFQSAEELTEGFMMAAELTFAGLDERGSERSGPSLVRPKEPSSGSTPGVAVPKDLVEDGGVDAEDEASDDPGDARPDEAAGEDDATPSSTPDPSVADEPVDDISGPHKVLDEPSSLGSSMSTNVSEPPVRRRSTLLMGATVVAALGVAYAAYALIGEERPAEPVEPGGEPSAAATAPSSPPLTTSADETPAPTASAPDPLTTPPEPAPSGPPRPSAVGSEPPAVVGPRPRPVPAPSASATVEPPEDDGPPTWFSDKEPKDGSEGSSTPDP